MKHLDEDMCLALSVLFGKPCHAVVGGYGHFTGEGTRRFVWGCEVPLKTYPHVSVRADVPLGVLAGGSSEEPFKIEDDAEVSIFINDKPYRVKWRSTALNPCRIVHIIPHDPRARAWLVGTICGGKPASWQEAATPVAA